LPRRFQLSPAARARLRADFDGTHLMIPLNALPDGRAAGEDGPTSNVLFLDS
jgi:hypothetical protein